MAKLDVRMQAFVSSFTIVRPLSPRSNNLSAAAFIVSRYLL
jgi:hypothetical protein